MVWLVFLSHYKFCVQNEHFPERDDGTLRSIKTIKDIKGKLKITLLVVGCTIHYHIKSSLRNKNGLGLKTTVFLTESLR